MLFAFSTASSGVRKVSTESTGPKISSWAIRELCATFVNTVGANQKPRSRAGGTRGWNISAPSSLPLSTSSSIRSSCSRELIAPRSVFLSSGSPTRIVRMPPLQLRDELLVDRLLHEQPRAGAADVALVEVDPVDDPLDRLVERAVVEDDVGGLAAELEREALARAGERALDRLADLGRAGEGDLVDPGMRDDARRSSRRR